MPNFLYMLYSVQWKLLILLWFVCSDSTDAIDSRTTRTCISYVSPVDGDRKQNREFAESLPGRLAHGHHECVFSAVLPTTQMRLRTAGIRSHFYHVRLFFFPFAGLFANRFYRAIGLCTQTKTFGSKHSAPYATSSQASTIKAYGK